MSDLASVGRQLLAAAPMVAGGLSFALLKLQPDTARRISLGVQGAVEQIGNGLIAGADGLDDEEVYTIVVDSLDLIEDVADLGMPEADTDAIIRGLADTVYGLVGALDSDPGTTYELTAQAEAYIGRAVGLLIAAVGKARDKTLTPTTPPPRPTARDLLDGHRFAAALAVSRATGQLVEDPTEKRVSRAAARKARRRAWKVRR